MKINLACGNKILDGYTNVDLLDFGQQVIGDGLEYLKSLKSETVDHVRVEHYLEHLTQDQIREYLKEIYRVLKSDGGMLYAIVPHKDKDKSYVLSHYTYWTEMTFKMLCDRSFCEVYDFPLFVEQKIVTNSRLDIHAELIKD